MKGTMNTNKYSRGYFMPPVQCLDWTKKEYIDKAPIWCSVDLRDGNQALIVPMNLEEKLEFFKVLVAIGFKEIEIGFPAASETEYEFCRALIEQDLIPDDVTIQVLTQSREHIIKKTFEALAGAKHAVVHLYNSTSVAQREQVFRKPKNEIIDIAVEGAKLLKEYREKTPGDFKFEYSPESFTGTEPEFALEICNAVLDVWQPTPDDKVIINLPVTVEMSLPHVYASQVEYMCKNMVNRENVIVSLHPHNDRGCAVADSELGFSKCGASLIVVKIAVGPSAPPIIPNAAASCGVKPINTATSNTVKIPNCAAAPKIERRRLRSIGPKSVKAPTPMKMIGGRNPVLINI